MHTIIPRNVIKTKVKTQNPQKDQFLTFWTQIMSLRDPSLVKIYPNLPKCYIIVVFCYHTHHCKILGDRNQIRAPKPLKRSILGLFGPKLGL